VASTIAAGIRLDHSIIGVSDWKVSNRFYRDVLGAEVISHGPGDRVAYRLGKTQLNDHGPGFFPVDNVARLPVRPGNSDLCFVWPGPIADAIAHLAAHGVTVETGPVTRLGAQGEGTSVYFRVPDGSLLEFITY
jgi:catechol 2,3-dioxygenase-like lactoylglutathione lyase family enzyme